MGDILEAVDTLPSEMMKQGLTLSSLDLMMVGGELSGADSELPCSDDEENYETRSHDRANLVNKPILARTGFRLA